MEVGKQELGTGEADTGNGDGGQHFHGTFKAAHEHAKPQRDDNGQEGQLTAHDGADGHIRHAGHLTSNDNRHTDGTEGHRGRVGDQTHTGGVQGLEAEPHQHGRSDGHRRTETGRTFQERAESEGNEDGLQATVIRQVGQRLLKVFKLAGLHRHVVDPHSRDHNPDDGEQAESCPIQEGTGSGPHGHPPNEYGQDCRQDHGYGRCIVTFGAAHGQHVEQGKQRDGRQQRREYGVTCWVVHLGPHHMPPHCDSVVRHLKAVFI